VSNARATVKSKQRRACKKAAMAEVEHQQEPVVDRPRNTTKTPQSGKSVPQKILETKTRRKQGRSVSGWTNLRLLLRYFSFNE